jgi:lysophospholipase L1-like esterase
LLSTLAGVSSASFGATTAQNPGSITGYWTNNNVILIPVGDSMTVGWGWGASTPINTWPGRFFANWNQQPTWKHFGGVAAMAGIPLTDLHTFRYPAEVYPFRPRNGTNALIVLWAGINDFRGFHQTAELVFYYYTEYVKRARSDGFKILTLTVTADLFLGANDEANRSAYNALLRKSPHLWDWLYDADTDIGRDIKYFSDTLHFNDLGYNRIAEGVYQTLQRTTGTTWPGITQHYPASDGFHLSVTARPGANVGIYRSPNLQGWELLRETVTASGNLNFLDASPLSSIAYYHVRLE